MKAFSVYLNNAFGFSCFGRFVFLLVFSNRKYTVMFPHARTDPEEPKGPESMQEVGERIVVYNSDDEEPDCCVSPSDTQGIKCQTGSGSKSVYHASRRT